MTIRPQPAVRLLAGIALAACLAALTAPVRAQQASQGHIDGGDSPSLFLLYTGDVIGYLDPCG